MFWKNLKMELVRACQPSKIVLVMGTILGLLIVSDWELIRSLFRDGYTSTRGSVEELYIIFGMDTFRCVIVVILSGLYTNSFCKDNNSRYLRMILNRTDVTIYTQCRFLVNFCLIVFVSIGTLYLYVLAMRPLMPLISSGGTNQGFYYMELATHYPMIYVTLTGYTLGLVTTACSSVGLLYSAYKSNSFVSIALSGLVFFIAVSYIPMDSPWNVLKIVNMTGSLGYDAPTLLTFLWMNLYMFSVIGICGLLFWRRMKWKVNNGYV